MVNNCIFITEGYLRFTLLVALNNDGIKLNVFQATLSELNRSHEIVKLITASLAKCHALAVSTCGSNPPSPDTLIDGKYTHDHVSSLLRYFYCLQSF